MACQNGRPDRLLSDQAVMRALQTFVSAPATFQCISDVPGRLRLISALTLSNEPGRSQPLYPLGRVLPCKPRGTIVRDRTNSRFPYLVPVDVSGSISGPETKLN